MSRSHGMGNSLTELNILVLGETGVGKSTWINAIANYMYYEKLQDAMKSEPLCLIPCEFIICDENYQQQKVTNGLSDNEVVQNASANENTSGGASATQKARIYRFETATHLVRIIDTPGIGDTRGVNTDAENCASILEVVSTLSKLHGICFLFKANDARLTPTLKYCISELLLRLHKNAVENIVFCFTNAKGTFYRPGQIMVPLTKYLTDLQSSRGISIKLDKSTIFCLDNEAFRFLLAYKSNIKFGDGDIQEYALSWQRSSQETKRMMEKIRDAKAHNVKESVSLNEARSTILKLAKPLADITEGIECNVMVQKARKQELENTTAELNALAKQLKIPKIVLRPENLDYPQTVCAGDKCTTVQTCPLTQQRQVIYNQICHDHCYLENISLQTVNQVGLRQCSAMSNNYCNTCRCHYSSHTHINFKQIKETIQVDDPTIKKGIQEKENASKTKQRAIELCEATICDLKSEQKIITDASTRFGSFLQANSILPVNDVYEEYIKKCIKVKFKLIFLFW
jgi:GTPase SAR1 family protein